MFRTATWMLRRGNRHETSVTRALLVLVSTAMWMPPPHNASAHDQPPHTLRATYVHAHERVTLEAVEALLALLLLVHLVDRLGLHHL